MKPGTFQPNYIKFHQKRSSYSKAMKENKEYEIWHIPNPIRSNFNSWLQKRSSCSKIKKGAQNMKSSTFQTQFAQISYSLLQKRSSHSKSFKGSKEYEILDIPLPIRSNVIFFAPKKAFLQQIPECSDCATELSIRNPFNP